MTVSLSRAGEFMTTHARLLDRRRFDLAVGRSGPDGVRAALAAYRNPDGGYGWGLEPDLRSPESQPVGALHALEVLEETGGAAGTLADWLASVTLADGGLPFALPMADPSGSGPWWVAADPGRSSLHLTTAIVSAAHRVATHDAALRGHPWLSRATTYCWDAITGPDAPSSAYELRYVLWFLDAVVDERPGASEQLRRLAARLPGDAVLPVEGGVEGEALRPLDIAPTPGRPLREHLAPGCIERDLDRVRDGQRPDGGWTVDHVSGTEAAGLEWRGHATVRAVRLLHAHGHLTDRPRAPGGRTPANPGPIVGKPTPRTG